MVPSGEGLRSPLEGAVQGPGPEALGPGRKSTKLRTFLSEKHVPPVETKLQFPNYVYL